MSDTKEKLMKLFTIEDPYESCDGKTRFTVQTVDDDGDSDGGIIAEFDSIVDAQFALDKFCDAVAEWYDLVEKQKDELSDYLISDRPLRIGDSVAWKSQSVGYTEIKHGVVSEVVAIKQKPVSLVPGVYNHTIRNHESYIVVVKNKFYWPLVKNLRLKK